MKTVEEIVAAARQLDPAQFLLLRCKLDRLEQKVWAAELKRVSAARTKANITDEVVDQMVMRRRRESRHCGGDFLPDFVDDEDGAWEDDWEAKP